MTDYATRIIAWAEEYVALSRSETEMTNTLERANAESNDLLHALELLNLSASTRARVVSRLVETRRIRRHAKDSLQILNILGRFNQKNQIYLPITKLLTDVNAIRDSLERRQYSPRSEVLSELNLPLPGGDMEVKRND